MKNIIKNIFFLGIGVLFSQQLFSQTIKQDSNVVQIPYEDSLIGYKKMKDGNFIFSEKDEVIAEVVYFFSYGCPHCFTFDETLKIWLKDKPSTRSFRMIPVTFRQDWEELAKAYVISKEYGILKDTHEKLFKYIHNDKNRISTKDDLKRFYATNTDITENVFNSIYNSQSLNKKIKDYTYFQDFFDIQGTPNLLIIGKNKKVFKISPEYTKTPNNMILTAELLIELIKRDMDNGIAEMETTNINK